MTMHQDLSQLDQLGPQLDRWCLEFLQALPQRTVAWQGRPDLKALALPARGDGSGVALQQFMASIAPGLSASAGPRYFGFVTGGVTPAALLADRLVGCIDQNVSTCGDSIAPLLEQQTIAWLRELLLLPDNFEGILTTGATSANLLGLLCGRQFAGLAQGIDIAANGFGNSRIRLYAATPHASTLKSAALAGFGRNNVAAVATLPNSEAMDTADLARQLEAAPDCAKIVIASVGTVTGTYFDDLETIADLCQRHGAWLHADGAFGLFARLLEHKRAWTQGIERVDSITTDCHKWLNVPYDCGLFLTRHPQLLQQTCAVAAPYLDTGDSNPAPMDRGIENSRRFRALPVWMSLLAYGREGFADLVARNCAQAAKLASWIDQSAAYHLLAPCRLNVVVFAPATGESSAFLHKLNLRGRVFLTPGVWKGKPAVRAAFSNWRTRNADVDILLQELAALARDQ
ncbi:pyridoxal phosphate-dependent decarboxylase family protein [Motiliproteus sediminis]|uniref:pyridoxal phosphate-dependent decarboxylase family protein n=1 Tax=Motiliproteus sediminis TaxID=1468178 RepID=UPI001FE5A7B5|nr:aminotransferase class I/II-fold pyridoxal phosphate-dependent enzyme [Motiliproteus sediminis]